MKPDRKYRGGPGRIWTEEEDAVVRNRDIPIQEMTVRIARGQRAINRRRLVLEVEGSDQTPRAARLKDAPLIGRPKRACSNCRIEFKPTLRRRLLCRLCFHQGDLGPFAA